MICTTACVIWFWDFFHRTFTECWVSVIMICTQLQAQHPGNAGQECCYILPVLGGTWVFDFINNYWFQFFWVAYQNQRIVNSAYLKIRNQRTISCFQLFSVVLKTSKNHLVSWSDHPRINGFFWGGYLACSDFENHGYVQETRYLIFGNGGYECWEPPWYLVGVWCKFLISVQHIHGCEKAVWVVD